MNKIDKLIINEFQSLGEDYWDFSDYKNGSISHNIHNYPAVMIYPISKTILSIVKKYKSLTTILDPFLGSGTVLLESMRANIGISYGTDLNPLALLISKAKTTLLEKHEIFDLSQFKNNIVNMLIDKTIEIKAFGNYVRSIYDITEKTGWADEAKVILNNYFDGKYDTSLLPKFSRLGFWFIPESLITLLLIKIEIQKLNPNLKYYYLINVSFSEFIRYVSNTRNGEFKLYRIKKDKLNNLSFDYATIFSNILDKNIEKIIIASNELNANLNVNIQYADCRFLTHIPDESIDIVITSPPYGDSGTTVAYGQFSRLSNEWLNVKDGISVDRNLLGGRKSKVTSISELQSDTLRKKYEEIASVDVKRANEVINFYMDLDAAIAEISLKTKKDGYHFWIVGNRTVKKIILPTDKIISELCENHGLQVLDYYYRNISNKVMPSQNSPSNETGQKVDTMTKETIIFLKKK
ncbi:MAG: hypothetical protein RBQ97_10275 [Acholeplasma sp.]|nr:hypothetical protein [Acholeplasma sp.]